MQLKAIAINPGKSKSSKQKKPKNQVKYSNGESQVTELFWQPSKRHVARKRLHPSPKPFLQSWYRHVFKGLCKSVRKNMMEKDVIE